MIKKLLKQNKTVYRILVNMIEAVMQTKERMIWDFWKKYPKIGLRVANSMSTKMVPVLYMHWFVTRREKNEIEKYSSSRWYAAIEDFEEQILWLRQHKYTFLTADEFYQWYIGEKTLPRKSVLLTFDDGEESNYHLVLPILQKHQIPATFFIIGKRIMEKKEIMPLGASESQVRYFTYKDYLELNEKRDLISFGSHSYNLHFFLNGKHAVEVLDEQSITDDFEKMKGHFSVNYFAAPYGAYNESVYKNVKKYHKMGFCVETPKCPYAKRGEDVYRIRRIRVDGLTTIKDFERML